MWTRSGGPGQVIEGHVGRVSGGPLDQQDAVAVRVREPGSPEVIKPIRRARRLRLDPAAGQLLDGRAHHRQPPRRVAAGPRCLWLLSADRARQFILTQRHAYERQLETLGYEEATFALEGDAIDDPASASFAQYATLRYGISRTRNTIIWCDWLLQRVEANSPTGTDHDKVRAEIITGMTGPR